jgi:hypothetical protein
VDHVVGDLAARIRSDYLERCIERVLSAETLGEVLGE